MEYALNRTLEAQLPIDLSANPILDSGAYYDVLPLLTFKTFMVIGTR